MVGTQGNVLSLVLLLIKTLVLPKGTANSSLPLVLFPRDDISTLAVDP